MIDFKEKNKVRRFVYSAPMLIFLGIILLVFIVQVSDLYKTKQEAARKAYEAKEELSRSEERKNELERRLNFMKTERGKESEIREKFMVGKEGEDVILVVDQPQATATQKIITKESFWSGFLNFFR